MQTPDLSSPAACCSLGEVKDVGCEGALCCSTSSAATALFNNERC